MTLGLLTMAKPHTWRPQAPDGGNFRNIAPALSPLGGSRRSLEKEWLLARRRVIEMTNKTVTARFGLTTVFSFQ